MKTLAPILLGIEYIFVYTSRPRIPVACGFSQVSMMHGSWRQLILWMYFIVLLNYTPWLWIRYKARCLAHHYGADSLPLYGYTRLKEARVRCTCIYSDAIIQATGTPRSFRPYCTELYTNMEYKHCRLGLTWRKRSNPNFLFLWDVKRDINDRLWSVVLIRVFRAKYERMFSTLD